MANTLEELIVEKTNTILSQVDGLTPAIIDEIFNNVQLAIKHNIPVRYASSVANPEMPGPALEFNPEANVANNGYGSGSTLRRN